MILTLSVVFLFLPSAIDAVITDEVLRTFCLGRIIDLPSGLPASDRVGDETCTQIVPAYSTDPRERTLICKRYAPFEIVSAGDANLKTKCVWKQKYQCTRGEKTFDTNCLVRTPPMTLAQVKSYCQQKHVALFSVKDRVEAQWMLRLFHTAGTNVWVNNSVDLSRIFFPKTQEIGYSRSNYDFGKNYRQVSVVGSHDWELGVYMGMLIPTKETERLVGFCSRSAIVSAPTSAPSGAPAPSPAPGASVNDSSEITFHLTPTLSAFLSNPFAFRNIERKAKTLEMEQMNAHCRRRYKDAFALPPTDDVLSRIAEYVNHPVYLAAFMSPPADMITNCTGDPSKETATMRQLFKVIDADGDTKTIPENMWQAGYPKAICSRHSAVAVVANAQGKLENFPSNARLPVLCGKGSRPVAGIAKLCQNPNSISLPNGTCACMSGTVDIVDTNLPERVNYPAGYYCIRQKPCHEIKTSLIFLMIVDESGSIDYDDSHGTTQYIPHWAPDVVPFVNMVIDHIPANLTFASALSRFSIEEDHIFMDGFDAAAARKFMEKPYAMGTQTHLHYSTGVMADYLSSLILRPTFPGPDQRSVVTLILTDGNCTNPDLALQDAYYIKDNGGRIIVFNIGNGAGQDFLNELVVDPNDIITEKDFSKIGEHIGQVMNTICPAPVLGDYTGETKMRR